MITIPKPLRYALFLIKVTLVLHILALLFWLISYAQSTYWPFVIVTAFYSIGMTLPYYLFFLIYLKRGSKMTRGLFVVANLVIFIGLLHLASEEHPAATSSINSSTILNYLFALLQLYACFLLYRPSCHAYFNQSS